jgi:hypothetical protein
MAQHRGRTLVLCALLAAACRHDEPPPIRVEGAWLVVENETSQPWKDVTVTVNAYYRAVSPALAPGGRLDAPLENFVTGTGHRFDTAREHVMRVELHATDASGNPVSLEWHENSASAATPQQGR